MILHVDMDAFFASVEERDNPELKGRPLVVGGRPEERGVVAAANYAAREYRIHSAMPMARAVRLCPNLLILPSRGKIYRQVSNQIHEIFNRYTPQIEPLSLDEAFLDVRASQRLFGSTEIIGRRIKREIREELGLVASMGVAPNKFLAKLASDQDKPDGFTVIRSGEVQSFLDPLPIVRIWGVGKVAGKRLHDAGIRTVADIRKLSENRLEEDFGKSGRRLWELCHGIDPRPVITDSEAKSISQEMTFSLDVKDIDSLRSIALSLTEGVCYRLRLAGFRARTVNLKVRYHDFSTVTRSFTFAVHTSGTLAIWKELNRMIGELLSGRRFSVRLIGVGVSSLSNRPCQENESQMDLFETIEAAESQQPESNDRQTVLDQLTDEARDRFGKNMLRRGRGISE